MFEQNYPVYAGSALGGDVPKECKPDPEDMLQAARKRIENCNKAEAMLMELAEMPVNISFGQSGHDGFMCAIGSIRAEYYRNKKDEEYWLKEIDS